MRVSAGLLALALLVPAAASAQTASDWEQEQIEDLRAIGTKFVALAEAFPEDTYDWRPMEGVRSVRDVMGLMIAEFYLFPTIWGHAAPEGTAADWGAAIAGFGALSKAEMVAEMTEASAWFMASVEGMTTAERAATADWFGRSVSTVSAIGLAAGDMHEHLGQAIAYARTNRVVPPWSR